MDVLTTPSQPLTVILPYPAKPSIPDIVYVSGETHAEKAVYALTLLAAIFEMTPDDCSEFAPGIRLGAVEDLLATFRRQYGKVVLS